MIRAHAPEYTSNNNKTGNSREQKSEVCMERRLKLIDIRSGDMAEVIERLSSIETTLGTIQQTLSAQNGWNEKTAQERTQHYTQTIEQLAVIKTVQADMKSSAQKYQDDCTADRDAHDKKLQDHDTQLKIIKAIAAWRAGLISMAISTAGVIAAFLLLHH